MGLALAYIALPWIVYWRFRRFRACAGAYAIEFGVVLVAFLSMTPSLDRPWQPDVAGDERDLVRLRTNFREHDEVYLYRLKPKAADRLELFFMDYIRRINELSARPEWYNALTENCMTSAYKSVRRHAVDPKWSWKIVFNGYFAELAYERGVVDINLPFVELKRISRINERARQIRDDEDFSREIRRGLPGP